MHVKNRGEFVGILAFQTDRVLGGDTPDFHCSSFYSFLLLLLSSTFIISSQLAESSGTGLYREMLVQIYLTNGRIS